MADSIEQRLSRGFELLMRAEEELFDMVEKDLGDIDDVGHDWYDDSFEVYGVDPDARLSPDTQQRLKQEGFARGWLNHRDGTETSYPSGSHYKANLKRTKEKRRRDLTAEVQALRERMGEAEKLIELVVFHGGALADEDVEQFRAFLKGQGGE